MEPEETPQRAPQHHPSHGASVILRPVNDAIPHRDRGSRGPRPRNIFSRCTLPLASFEEIAAQSAPDKLDVRRFRALPVPHVPVIEKPVGPTHPAMSARPTRGVSTPPTFGLPRRWPTRTASADWRYEATLL
jgi:hypothetical protein